MKIDAAEIIDRLAQEDDRAKTSLYISKRIYEKFKRGCGKALPSRVVEELMKQFIAGIEKD